MRKLLVFSVIPVLLLLAFPASADLVFGSGAEDVLYSGDGVAPLDALFGSALAISPGETLTESALVCLDSGGRLYLQCQNLPQSLRGLRLTVQGEAPVYDGTLGANPWIYLGRFPAGTREALTFTLYIPEDLSPQGQQDWQALSWHLLAELPPSPATGDESCPLAATVTAVLSGIGLAVFTRKKKLFP